MQTINTADFIAWLKRQPKDRPFDYLDNDECPCASFAKEELKLKDAWAGSYHVFAGRTGGKVLDIPDSIDSALRSQFCHFTAAQLLRALEGE